MILRLSPLWKDPEMIALATELIKYLGLAVIFYYLIAKIIVPLSKTMLSSPPPKPSPQTIGGNVDVVDEDTETQAPSAAKTLERKLEHARDLAQQDPKVVANIIKDWTGANANG